MVGARRVRSVWWALALLPALVLAACGRASGATTHPAPPIRAAICADTVCAAQHVRIFVEPDAGEAPIVQAIAGATRSVWVEVYLLTDRAVIHALEDAVARGLDVRVVLEPHPFGGGDVSAERTLEELVAAGVQARAANPAYTFTHEKALVVDGATAYILTANLTRSGLGGGDVIADRDYGVIDTDPGDVANVRAIFLADWERRTPMLTEARLVVSPVNARASLTALIGRAARSLRIEDEELLDGQIEDALMAAARRGVSVEIVLPVPGSGATDVSNVARLARGGVLVRQLTAPYVHAKLVLVDDRLAFVGSENFSGTSLDANRELGIVLADADALGTLSHAFTQDWALAMPA